MDGDFFELTEDIALWTHVYAGIFRKYTVIHLKTIMMLGNGYYIPCTGFFKEVSPFGSIEIRRGKHRNKILVSKIFMRPIGLYVMLIFRRTLNVHIS